MTNVKIRLKKKALTLADSRGRTLIDYSALCAEDLLSVLLERSPHHLPTLFASATHAEREALKGLCWAHSETRSAWVHLSYEWSSITRDKPFTLRQVEPRVIYSTHTPYLTHQEVYRTRDGGVYLGKGTELLSLAEYEAMTHTSLSSLLDDISSGITAHIAQLRQMIASPVLRAEVRIATPDGVSDITAYGLESLPISSWRLPPGATFLEVTPTTPVSP